MKRVLLSLGLLVLFSVVGSSIVLAGANDQARFALEVNSLWVSTKAIPTLCADNPNDKALDCVDYPVDWGTGAANVWIVVGQAGPSGITGASFGINYDGAAGSGVDPQYVTFTYCGDGLTFANDGGNGDFPQPLGGLRVTWSTCQNAAFASGVQAVVGALYVYAYSPANLWLTPNNNLQSGPELAVTACGGGTTDLLTVLAPYGGVDGALGQIGFSTAQGYTPCGVVPAKETTWGKLKNLYNK